MGMDYEENEFSRQDRLFRKLIAHATGLSQSAVERLLALSPADVQRVAALVERLTTQKEDEE